MLLKILINLKPVKYRSVYTLARTRITTSVSRTRSTRSRRRPVVNVINVVVRTILDWRMVISLKKKKKN